jgi:hypothetical protein
MPLKRFDFRLGGYKNYRNMALLTIIIYLTIASILTILRFTYVNEVENFAVTRNLVEEEGIIDESFAIMHGGAPQLIGLAIILSILIFGPLDGIFSFILWRVRPPLRNEGIVIPLYVIYISTRLFLMYFIFQVLIWTLANQNPATAISLIYILILTIALGDISIMLFLHKMVFSKKWMGRVSKIV